MANTEEQREARQESKAEIEKRVLEAEKIVVSNILYNWARKYGMDYAIFVQNPGAVWCRVRAPSASGVLKEMKAALVRSGELVEYSCLYCKWEGVVDKTSDYTRCPNCGAM